MTFTDTLPTPAPAGPGPLAIDLQGLHKSFGSVRAVDGIDLAIAPGEVVAFLGPNGAGKTTTIDMLLGPGPPGRRHGHRVSGIDPQPAIAARPGLRRHAERRPAQGPHGRRDRPS